MKITFLGAAGEVTGSAYLVETHNARVLLDFGFFQGGDDAHARNAVPDEIDPESLDAVVVTHGHLDHTGRLPLLARTGFSGEIWATPATYEMAAIILADSAKVQRQDIDRINRRRQRAGREMLDPLYHFHDVEAILKRFKEAPYGSTVEVAPGVEAKFTEAGHMLGSASVALHLREGPERKRIVFSGDLGPRNMPILCDAKPFSSADAVILESTYGDRDHRSPEETIGEFRGLVREAYERRSKILIPAFAIGRTQQIVYHLAEIFRHALVPEFPVYVDSPMAGRATDVYRRHPELYDEQARALHASGDLQEAWKSVRTCDSVEESMALNRAPGPCAIIAGSGMCTAGRILHHLRNGLWRPETIVVIVGYQAAGTIGRQLVERRPRVKIFGEEMIVKAEIRTLGGFSAHAGQTHLLEWFEPLAATKPRTFLTHGESQPRHLLGIKLRDRHGIQAELPDYGDCLEL